MNREADIHCVAGILVGGRSTRMGRPKATLLLPDGRSLIEHIAGAVAQSGPWIDETVILGGHQPLPNSLAMLRSLPDSAPGAGPLVGLCSLLEHAGPRWGLLLACDMPLLEPGLLERLRAAVTPQYDVVAFRRIDRPRTWHACCALYHPRFLPAAQRELTQGSRSLQNLLATARVATLEATPEELRMLANLNTPQDYDEFLQRA